MAMTLTAVESKRSVNMRNNTIILIEWEKQ